MTESNGIPAQYAVSVPFCPIGNKLDTPHQWKDDVCTACGHARLQKPHAWLLKTLRENLKVRVVYVDGPEHYGIAHSNPHVVISFQGHDLCHGQINVMPGDNHPLNKGSENA